MNRDAMQKLRLDRRLIRRRGWVSKAELEKELESLPDVSDKIASPDDEHAESEDAPPAAAPGTDAPREE